MKLLRNILSAALTSLLLIPISTHAENPVLNPGFEEDAATPVEWGISAVANGAKAEIDSKEFHSGERSLRLDQTSAVTLPTGANEAESMAKILIDNKAGGSVNASQKIPVEEGESYDFSFWYKASGLLPENVREPKKGYAHLMVWIYWQDNQNRRVEGDTADTSRWIINQGVDAPDWVEAMNKGFGSSQRLNGHPCVAPPGARFANISFQLITNAPRVTPKVWIDDVSFQKTGQ